MRGLPKLDSLIVSTQLQRTYVSPSGDQCGISGSIPVQWQKNKSSITYLNLAYQRQVICYSRQIMCSVQKVLGPACNHHFSSADIASMIVEQKQEQLMIAPCTVTDQ